MSAMTDHEELRVPLRANSEEPSKGALDRLATWVFGAPKRRKPIRVAIYSVLVVTAVTALGIAVWAANPENRLVAMSSYIGGASLLIAVLLPLCWVRIERWLRQ